jgi:hypothetical protein
MIRRRNIFSLTSSSCSKTLFSFQFRQISGLVNNTTIHPSEIKICDLKEILGNIEKGKKCETEINYINLEIQRRLRRTERLIKAAPYSGGAFIQTYIYEARDDIVELEKVVEIFQEKLGKEYVEKFKKRVETMKDDAKEVEYNADLI